MTGSPSPRSGECPSISQGSEPQSFRISLSNGEWRSALWRSIPRTSAGSLGAVRLPGHVRVGPFSKPDGALEQRQIRLLGLEQDLEHRGLAGGVEEGVER